MKNKPSGLGVDSSGGPVIDPTANVFQLVIAAVTRLDDLRVAESKRLEDLQLAHMMHINEVTRLRAEYQEKLTIAESKRIDAIRAVDVGAVAIASEKASQQAAVLATQVAQSAETLRALVGSTNLQLTERISALEKSSYVGSGRQAVSDPMLAEVIAEIRRLRGSRDTDTGQHEGKTAVWSYIVAIVGILIGVSGVLIAIVKGG